MAIGHALTQSIAWTNTPDTATDSEGNWVPGTATTTTEPCCLQPLSAQELFDQGSDRSLSHFHLFLLPTTVGTYRSRGVIGGLTYEVEVAPQVWSTPRGGPHHAEAQVYRIDE